MKKEKQVGSLVLSLVALSGVTRRIVAEYVQRELFKLGYFWSHSNNGQPQLLDSCYLFVASPDWHRMHITYANTCISTQETCFYAATQVEAFLAAAKAARLVETEYFGIKVTIGPDSIDADTTVLLTRVMDEAKRKQVELFG